METNNELKFYTDIQTLPLYRFLQCLCNGNFEFLYKEQPTERDEVKEMEVYTDLIMQYNDASGEPLQYESIKKIAVLLGKIRICEAAMALIDKMPENVSGVLKSMGIRITSDANHNVLVLQGKISAFVREYKNLNEKEEKKKPTMWHYVDVLTAMSTHFKVHLDIQTLTVASFCSYYKQFLQEIESIRKLKIKN